MQRDIEYFRFRTKQEQEAAMRATDKSVRLRHLEFAAAYAFRAREIEAEQRRSALQLVDAA